MKRKQIILVALTAVLVAVAGVAVWRWLSPEPVPKPTGLSTPIELVEIPPGEFLMGSPKDEEGRFDHEPQHLVRITYAFKMGKYEVTQKQWREVMGTTIQQQRDKEQRDYGELPSFGKRLMELGKEIKDNPFGAFEEIRDSGVWQTVKWLAVGEVARWPLAGEGNEHPMYYVSWDEAAEFCRCLTDLERAAGRIPTGHKFRLPTEAEWEYACRTGSTTRFANGDTEGDLDKIGWYGDNSGGITHPVGTKLPNAWGLHDMHGNVWEWCHDWYDDYPADEVVDSFGPATGSSRVFRGGSWSDPSRNCRSASRAGLAPGLRSFNLGFRVVLAPVRPRE
jgi:formylglycine-generating enzyme required for sulfatase activity